MRCALAFVVSVLCCAPAFSQIIYQPVRYQYSACGQTYYYGGSDPAMIRWADYHACDTHRYFNRHNFDGGQSFDQPSPFFKYDAVYSDHVPYFNAAHLGYDAADAANEALSRIPLYFRKADQIRAGDVNADGTVTVPADAQPLVPVHHLYGATGPATRQGQIIIIPKRLLDRPLRSFEKTPQPVALAN